MSVHRVRVSLELGSRLLPGMIFRDGVIRSLSVKGKRVVVEVIRHIENPVDDHRQPRRPWRP